MSTIRIGIPSGTEWPVTGWHEQEGRMILTPGFLEAIADANGLGLDWHHPERPPLTDAMVGELLDAWYMARLAAGYPPCVHMEMLRARVVDDMVDGTDDY